MDATKLTASDIKVGDIKWYHRTHCQCDDLEVCTYGGKASLKRVASALNRVRMAPPR